MITEIVSKPDVQKNVGGGRHRHSRFPMGYPKSQTLRFAEYAPVFAMKVVPDDGPIDIQIPTELRSYTLKAPLMGSNIRMKQDLFYIRKESILPRAAEYIIKNPKHGDDAPIDANSVVYGFKKWITEEIQARQTYIEENIYDLVELQEEEYYDKGLVKAVLDLLVFMETFLSAGSLLANLEYSMEGYFTWNNKDIEETQKQNFGAYFDYIIRKLLFDNGKFILEGKNIELNGDVFQLTPETIASDGKLSLRQFICEIRENPGWDFEDTFEVPQYIVNMFYTGEFFENIISISEDEDAPFNYEKLIAYQIACAHFFSNDNVDYIYNAQLWRDNMQSIYMEITGQTSIPTWNFNGITMQYDALSGKIFKDVMITIENSQTFWNQEAIAWLYNIFSFRRSLRDWDYFTGSRTQPLAVGNVDVAVNNNKVSVIDITKNIQKQRFLNAVNRAKNGIRGYIKEIFGIEDKEDNHNPFWLGHTKDDIGAPETENTATEQYEKQLAVTAQFRCGSSNKKFTLHFDMYGIVIAIRYFDIPRLYYRGIHRHFFEADRFDMFLPEMQYIGDQPIYADEIDCTKLHVDYFGYTGRDMDYKLNYGRACGGFVHNLPGYCFLADHNRGIGIYGNLVQSPDYIRSTQTELDEFYNILTGYSLETYFHFLTISNIMIDSSRPMAYNPQILR